MHIESPVLILLYNREDLTRRLLSILTEIGTFSSLYIAIDGPKDDPLDFEKVENIKHLVNSINFSNELKVLSRENNLGCKVAVSEAIDWFFSNVSEGVILEDDCHPTKEFFQFVQYGLDKFRFDTRIAQICGSNTLGSYLSDSDYIYSNFGSIWGWATWKRSWEKYDVNIANFNDTRKQRNIFRKRINFLFDYLFRIKNFRDVKKGKVDTWDYQWMFTRLNESMLSVIPSRTLVTNVGIGLDSTHTKSDFGQKRSNPRDIFNDVNWSNPTPPVGVIPDYEFELAVLELKRGFRGFGPLWFLSKIVSFCKRKLLKNIKVLVGE